MILVFSIQYSGILGSALEKRGADVSAYWHKLFITSLPHTYIESPFIKWVNIADIRADGGLLIR